MAPSPETYPASLYLPAASGMASGKMRCDLARILLAFSFPSPPSVALGIVNTAFIACAAAAFGLLSPPISRAQAAYEATARVNPPRDRAQRRRRARPATTSVDLLRRTAPLETAADVLLEVPGARSAESGGYGSFASVSLRGNEPSHTTFWLGAVPLNDPESGTFDVSLLPLSHFARLAVYRGGAPLWLSQGAIAGAVRLVPRDDAGTGVEARLGAGSFGLLQASRPRTCGRSPSPRCSWFTSAQAAHSDSDYPYVDDRKSRFDASDDLERAAAQRRGDRSVGALASARAALGRRARGRRIRDQAARWRAGRRGPRQQCAADASLAAARDREQRLHVPRTRRGRARLCAATAVEWALHRQRALRPVRRARLRRVARPLRHAAARLRAARR